MELVDLIGPMLGADFLFAEGEVLDEDSARPGAVVHRFWAHRHRWRVERDDGVTFVDDADTSATLVHGRVTEAGVGRHGPGFHIAERLLRPRYAPIWGRTEDDWGLTAEVKDADGDLVEVALRGMGGRWTERGSILVDPRLGRLHKVSTPGFTWTLLRVGEESPPDWDQVRKTAG